MKQPKVSIVIPVGNVYRQDKKGYQTIQDNLKGCIENCLKLDYDNYEILILPDHESRLKYPKTKVYPTSAVPPSKKRDIAMEIAKGEILAFIDDDAFPRKDWLKKAVKFFKDKDVGAVCGPQLTPPSDNILQKASGYVLSSFLGGGNLSFRYTPKKQREIDDATTCNFLVRKSLMKKIGGFETRYWPGEDTKFCLDLTKKFNKKIIYSPDVVVYHHRRPLFKKHLTQIWNYGVHRGFFVRKFPETSFRLGYFLPSLFVIGLFFGWTSIFIDRRLLYLYLLSVCSYSILSFLTGLKTKNLRIAMLVFLGIIATHVWYGIGFLKGLFSSELEK